MTVQLDNQDEANNITFCTPSPLLMTLILKKHDRTALDYLKHQILMEVIYQNEKSLVTLHVT